MADLDYRIINSGEYTPPRSLLDLMPKAQSIGAGLRAAEDDRMKLIAQKKAMADEKTLSQSLKDSTELDSGTGAPKLNLPKLAGQLAMQGNSSAVPIASMMYKEDNDLKIKHMEAGAKFASSEWAVRKLVKGIVDSAIDADSTDFARTQLRNLGYDDRVPPEFMQDGYDKGVVEKTQQGMLQFETRQQQALAKKNSNLAERSATALEGARDDERDVRKKGQDLSVVERANNDWNAGSGMVLLKAQQAKNKVDAFAENFNVDGTVKGDMNETAVDAGLADGLGLYGFANERDPLGAVMTSDVTVTLSQRGLLAQAEAGFMKLLGGGGLLPEERVAVKALSDILYQKQVGNAEVNRQALRKQAAESAIRGSFWTPQEMADKVGNTGYLPGQKPTRYIAAKEMEEWRQRKTEGSTAPGAQPAGALPPTAGSGAATAHELPVLAKASLRGPGDAAPKLPPTPQMSDLQKSLNDLKVGAESGGQQFDKDGNTTLGWITEGPNAGKIGGVGISQINPTTASDAAKIAGVPYNERWLYKDPAYNKLLGDAYMAAMFKQFPKDPDRALAAYNSGPNNNYLKEDGAGWLKKAPPETQNYIVKIMGRKYAQEHGISVEDGVAAAQKFYLGG